MKGYIDSCKEILKSDIDFILAGKRVEKITKVRVRDIISDRIAGFSHRAFKKGWFNTSLMGHVTRKAFREELKEYIKKYLAGIENAK